MSEHDALSRPLVDSKVEPAPVREVKRLFEAVGDLHQFCTVARGHVGSETLRQLHPFRHAQGCRLQGVPVPVRSDTG